MGMLYLHEFAHMHANVLESLSGDLPAGAFRESFPGDNDDATGITSASTPATTNISRRVRITTATAGPKAKRKRRHWSGIRNIVFTTWVFFLFSSSETGDVSFSNDCCARVKSTERKS